MKENQEKELYSVLKQKEYATIDELATAIYASPSTVRRRLTELEKKGLVTRTHGGAQLTADGQFPSFSIRSRVNIAGKKRIALSALKLIKNGDILFLDGSTSAFFIAEYLKEFSGIKVITNGIDTLSLLSKNGVDAYSTGGRISEQNRSVLVGAYAEHVVENLQADLLFFSAQSVQENGGVYDCFEEENLIRKRMMAQSTKRVLLCDDTKLHRTSPFKLCNVQNVDYIVCERDLKEYFSVSELPEIIFD
ncbi:MAG: DeoR/GlpR transcriptional regulator [Clostridia bacterium]|nr:DeoR/GlpR transcriptional regulator [Clostridia bacterium]